MPDVSLERLLIMARRKTVSYEGVVAVGELVRVFPHSSWRPRSVAACALSETPGHRRPQGGGRSGFLARLQVSEPGESQPDLFS